MSDRRDNFERVVKRRLERFDSVVETFMGLSNKQQYDYTAEDVNHIIEHMTEKVTDVMKSLRSDKQFTLNKFNARGLRSDELESLISKIRHYSEYKKSNIVGAVMYDTGKVCCVVERVLDGEFDIVKLNKEPGWVKKEVMRCVGLGESLGILRYYSR